MTTITTARQIFYSYPKLPVDAPMPEYVSSQDYEVILGLLKQWADIPSLMDEVVLNDGDCLIPQKMRSDKLTQLITDTKAKISTLGKLD